MAKNTKKKRKSKKVTVTLVEPVDPSKKLGNWRQELFCGQYIKDGNGTQAAVRVGYSARSAQQHASRMMLIDVVKKRIEYLQKELSDACGVDTKFLMGLLKNISTSNAMNYSNEYGMKGLLELLPSEGAVITHVTTALDKGQTKRKITDLSLEPRIPAIREMGKMIGAYEKDNRQKAETLAEFLIKMKCYD